VTERREFPAFFFWWFGNILPLAPQAEMPQIMDAGQGLVYGTQIAVTET
jgi:hypothetical protein